MKPISMLPLLAVVALAGTGCATISQPAAGTLAASASTSCHTVLAGSNNQTLCGTREEWREIDRRLAAVDSRLTCRQSRTRSEQCMTVEQWKAFDQRQRSLAQADRMGMEQQSSTLAFVPYAPQFPTFTALPGK